MNLLALLLGLSVLLQGTLPLLRGGLEWRACFQAILLSLALAAFTAQLWRVRIRLSPHVDMLLLMGGFGGLGMLLGNWQLDSMPICHTKPLTGSAAMCVSMLAAGLLPALRWSRCLQIARQAGSLMATLLLDTAGMLAGMLAVHAVLSRLQFDAPALTALVHHSGMSIGMLAGMGMAMTLRPVLQARLTRASI